MNRRDYPALYRSADTAAVAAQRAHLCQITLQYALLVSAATSTLYFDNTPVPFVVYAMLVGGAACLLIYMSFRPRERAWYACRTLAESVKTTTWRYVMCAYPYGKDSCAKEVDASFASMLQDQIATNTAISPHLADVSSPGPQITLAMKNLRSMPLAARKDHYRIHRIEEQCTWYRRKAKGHRCQFRAWIAAAIFTQVAAICLALLRIEYHDVWFLWPTAPLLLLSSSFLAWIQVKKFNELASAYDLAQTEISLIETSMDHIETEGHLSKFVNNTELVFSREHTLWAARCSL